MSSNGSGPDTPPMANMERHVAALVEALPIFDTREFEAAVAEVKERPRSSLRYLFHQFDADDVDVQAIVRRIVVACAGSDVIDNLNGIIFDADQSEWAKVVAADLLERMGEPMDPDVFAMSVPEPDALREKLPSRATTLLSEGKVDEAVAQARTLGRADRAILMHDALADTPDSALAFIEGLIADNEDSALAAVAALGSSGNDAAGAFLQKMQQTAGRTVQKQIKKTLFELREDGVAVPEETPVKTASAAASKPTAKDELPVFRAMMSDASPTGSILVVIARERSDRRLRVFSVLVSLWKRGIQQAATNPHMSRSSFGRFLRNQEDGRMKLHDANVDECRAAVARGMRVAKEFGTPLPFDFGAGKELLGDIDAEAAAIESPFLCSECGKPLADAAVEKIRASAPYENIPVETRCEACRENPARDDAS